jgi:hypothetical protein
MKKLNQTQRSLVEECRAKIAELMQLQNEAYNTLCEQIEFESDWLFDYIFNSSDDSSKEYKQLIEEKIFENN